VITRVAHAAVLAALITAFPANASAATLHSGSFVMGTILEVTVVTEDAVFGRQLATQAIETAKKWEDVLTTWRPNGELAGLNASAGAGPRHVSADLASALAVMIRLSEATDQAFDPGVGPLVEHYSHPGATRPSHATAYNIREVLTLNGRTAELARGAAIDAGGIGKGIALDAIAKDLRAAGVKGAYLDFGRSSQLALGTMENGRPWTVALAGLHPGTIHGFIELDGALSTSRARAIGDETGPIIDPRTGDAITSPRFVTCCAPTATEAEAWSKALIVRGEAAALERPSRGLLGALYEDSETLRISPGFARMVVSGLEPRASM